MILVQVDPDVKPLITEIKLDIDAIKPEHGGHLERFNKYQILINPQRVLGQ